MDKKVVFKDETEFIMTEEEKKKAELDAKEMDLLIQDVQDEKMQRICENLEKKVYMKTDCKAVWDKLPLRPIDKVEILVDFLKKQKPESELLIK